MARPVSSPASQQGYVLLFVLAALALMSFGVGRYAARVELMRDQVRQLQDEAQARLKAANAQQMALYWLSTRPIGYAASGFADEAPVQLDGRRYRMPDGGEVQIMDDRGLLSMNAPDADTLVPTLVSAGASHEEAVRMVAILEDYVDADDLRRLNGAERAEYEFAGLPPPRNARIVDAAELHRMPLWKDRPELLARMEPWLGYRQEKLINPNTAPLPLLKAMWPRIGAEQWATFDLLRRRTPFPSALAARAATGIPFDDDHFIFHASAALRLRVWAPGLPQWLDYNIWITPAGIRAPWLIHSTGRGAPFPDPVAQGPQPIENFPVPSAATARSESVQTAAP